MSLSSSDARGSIGPDPADADPAGRDAGNDLAEQVALQRWQCIADAVHRARRDHRSKRLSTWSRAFVDGYLHALQRQPRRLESGRLPRASRARGLIVDGLAELLRPGEESDDRPPGDYGTMAAFLVAGLDGLLEAARTEGGALDAPDLLRSAERLTLRIAGG